MCGSLFKIKHYAFFTSASCRKYVTIQEERLQRITVSSHKALIHRLPCFLDPDSLLDVGGGGVLRYVDQLACSLWRQTVVLTLTVAAHADCTFSFISRGTSMRKWVHQLKSSPPALGIGGSTNSGQGTSTSCDGFTKRIPSCCIWRLKKSLSCLDTPTGRMIPPQARLEASTSAS